MLGKCFYCEAPGLIHTFGCPQQVYRDGGNARAAIVYFEQGFDEGLKCHPVATSQDPSYQLGLNRALAETDHWDFDDGGGASRSPDAKSGWVDWSNY